MRYFVLCTGLLLATGCATTGVVQELADALEKAGDKERPRAIQITHEETGLKLDRRGLRAVREQTVVSAYSGANTGAPDQSAEFNNQHVLGIGSGTERGANSKGGTTLRIRIGPAARLEP